MKTAILQVPLVTHSLLHIWCFFTHFPQTISLSQNQQCQLRQQEHSWDHQLFNLTYLHTPLPDARRFQHNERDNCPSFHNIFHQQDILSAQQQSLCPWTYVKHYDPDRYPYEMFYARCSCKRCVSWDTSGIRHECRAHYHAFSVIRRVCEDGRYRFYRAHEYLPIACVCSHENIRVVG